jgi:hypothetical protein
MENCQKIVFLCLVINMKLLTSNGREYSIQPLDYITSNDQTNKSAGHLLARKLLKELYPGEWILEEVPAKIDKSTLFVDFIIKRHRIVVEVQGQQHIEFNEFFHKTKEAFRDSQTRDRKKIEWCEINHLTLIQLPYPPNEIEWKKILNG